jgi:hypothetical protein
MYNSGFTNGDYLMNKQDIARLIIDVYNAGKKDGQSIGYEIGYGEGYEEAYDRAFTAGQEDGMAQVAGIDEEEYKAGYVNGYRCSGGETCPMSATEAYRLGWAKGYDDDANDRPPEPSPLGSLPSIQPAKWPYDSGWNDGYEGKDPGVVMKHDSVYMWGYKNGRKQRIAAMK